MTSSSSHINFLREKVVAVLKENPTIPGLESFTAKADEIAVEEDPLLDQGLVNFLVRVRAPNGSTVVAKYAPPYVKKYGEKAPLSQARAETEWMALRLLEKYSPGSAPKPYMYSSEHSIILMEYLDGYTMLRKEILGGSVNKKVIENLAVHLATIHNATHKDNISATEWEELRDNNKHFSLMEDVVQAFTSYPYITEPKDDVTRRLKEIAQPELADQAIRNHLQIKDCFGVGDTKDVLIKGNDAKLIDPEFAHLGPSGGDVGAFLAPLVMAYFYHLLSPEDNEKHRQIADKIQDCCYHMINTYIKHLSWKRGEREDHVGTLLKNIAQHLGFELYRSLCNGEHADLGAAQVELVEAGIRLMKQYHVVDSVDKLMSIALALE